MRRNRSSPGSPIPPLDAAGLDRLALRYVERFATTRGKLADYLRRKIGERGWTGAVADPAAVAERMAELGYVDDRAFAAAKAGAMARRGLGARRIDGALRQAGVQEEDRDEIAPDIADGGLAAALAYARRRRIGPWGTGEPDRAAREKQIAAMLRAGHRFDLARRIVALPSGEPIDTDCFERIPEQDGVAASANHASNAVQG